jgi:hypothetical protein
MWTWSVSVLSPSVEETVFVCGLFRLTLSRSCNAERKRTNDGHDLMLMTYESMMIFAETWIAAWNRRDVEAVLAHFAEDAQFVSPVARNFVGRPVLRNKKEIEDYWLGALDRISILEFKLDHATWDERRRELNVVYDANLNGERKRACENMQFDASGRQIRGEAFYGAAI